MSTKRILRVLVSLAFSFSVIGSDPGGAFARPKRTGTKAKAKTEASKPTGPADAEEKDVEGKTAHAGEKDPYGLEAGPTAGKLGSEAAVNVESGYLFTGSAGAQKIMQELENPTDGSELGLIMPARKDGWMAIFEFEPIGYVKDDDKDKLDADEILDSIKEGNAASNEQRKAHGWTPVNVIGWDQPPHYDPATHNVIWAIKGESEGHEILNYNTRVLGRNGVMSVTLLVSPEKLKTSLPEYQKMIAGFAFSQGSRYGEYRKGDKLAEYGLVGLIAGGAALAAAKTGLFAKAWKFLVVIVVGAAAGIKKLFVRKSPPAVKPGPTGGAGGSTPA